MIKFFIRFFGRRKIINALFTGKEQTAIVNALFRRAETNGMIDIDDIKRRKILLKVEKKNEFDMEARCHQLAMKWYE
jgi:hypothetical protein